MTIALNASVSASAPLSGSFGLLAGNAKAAETERKFSALIDGIQAGLDTKAGTGTDIDTGSASPAIAIDPRLPGDYISSFHIDDPSDADRNSAAQGAAANAGMNGIIDKSSKLYEQSLELESYVVKMMLSSMRNTVQKSGLSGENDFASKMYEDMLYDELARDMTKNAGFGLADQIYLQLSR
ncbi:MAG TPA: rod-binding protein [Treponemataceae bacterium]|jgi:flagellar protein FlgJ|nr:MAG: flagellar protein [Treponema sp.]HOC28606.1 rod-binding protein [Treponemataceae bacterium]HQL33269.1 rod-binding protein [Treponemataceae bacterium]